MTSIPDALDDLNTALGDLETRVAALEGAATPTTPAVATLVEGSFTTIKDMVLSIQNPQVGGFYFHPDWGLVFCVHDGPGYKSVSLGSNWLQV